MSESSSRPTPNPRRSRISKETRESLLLWEDGDVYDQLRGVMIKGTARLVTDHSEVFPLALEVMKRNQPDIPGEVLEQAANQMAAKLDSCGGRAPKSHQLGPPQTSGRLVILARRSRRVDRAFRCWR